ncbi:arginine--tRNA ligase [Pirellulales bacterium]|nr:arginine--tRNA ligase [Pirellulales bacterium]
MYVVAELRRRFAAALSSLDEGSVDYAEMVLPAQDPKFGDYQANCAMPLGKRLGKPPREIAAALVEALEVDDLCDPPEIAGPGFINLRLRNDWIVDRLQSALADSDGLGFAPIESPKTIVIDFSSPNIAKPMHVGHIRSTVIGDALARVLRRIGHRVITDNHIGDWGTQFGMILYGYKHFVDEQALTASPIEELSRLYRLVNRLIEYHAARKDVMPAARAKIKELTDEVQGLRASAKDQQSGENVAAAKRLQDLSAKLVQLQSDLVHEEGKLLAVESDDELSVFAQQHKDIGKAVLEETAALHAGEATNRRLWQRFLPACLDEMDRVYQLLNIEFDYTLGESFYHDALAGVVAELKENGIVKESDGAECIFVEGFKAPLIVQKRDGAFLYATTDLATVEYRMREWNPDAILYVVDHRQSQHFQQLFAAARLWGYNGVELQHIMFGAVLGKDGKPYKTRSGSAVGLAGLLHEAVERALTIVAENDDARETPLLSDEQRREVARRIGIGAVKYADLAHNRESDYVFSFEKMLAMTGNTATYMQYSYARICSICEKAGVDRNELRQTNAAVCLDTPQERALGAALLRVGEALARVAEDYRPNHLTSYLFDLASKYSDFFENCPVLKAETEELRTSRLALCDLTARTIKLGLGLLGIEVVERM